ncbi:squamous cell carcinoma antigen recognized by T-cells 3-like [Ptychodera flava]|uniref:squamous cell carcinoma antigen recognized by T-cells 3-like n=1 Tax=Ptychodera flava TaxID=63121 RepID=UPI00396A1E3A
MASGVSQADGNVVHAEEEQMEVEEGESDSSSSDDSGSDDGGNEEAITALEGQVSANPFQYDLHVQLIKLLRKEGELDRLRQARERMHQLFPMNEDLWLEWLKDEIGVSSEDRRENIMSLFERAANDYMSVPIWLEYVQYSIGSLGDADGMTKIRNVYERAITAVGLHLTKGAAIWEAYREFENVILQTIQPSLGATVTPEKQEEISLQTEKITSLFKRQLSVPLIDMENTFQEFEQWLSDPVPDHISQAYKKALAKLEKRKPYEDDLLVAAPPRYQEYQSYIEYEKSEGDPTRIQCIYERALQENCLVTDLWKQYSKYIDGQLKISRVSLKVHERAVRNCPWNVGLWQDYLLALERYEQPHEQIKEVFEKAMNSGLSQGTEYFQLWQSYIDYLRRRIDWKSDHEEELDEFRKTMRRAIDYLAEYFGSEADPTCSLQQYWARIEAGHCDNKQLARELWEEIMSGHAKEAQMWLENYNFERAFGDIKHSRKVLIKAVQSSSDWPESVCEALLTLEREEGTLEQYEAAVSRVESQMNRVNERRVKAAEKEAEFSKQKQEKAEQRKQVKAEKKAFKKEEIKPVKRKVEDLDTSTKERHDPQKDKDGFKVPTLPPGMPTKAVADEPPEKKQKVETTELKPGQVLHDPSKDDRTVFVKNLSYELTEDRIREIFTKCGDIVEIRMVSNFKNKFKGYCYIEFNDEFSVKKALELDRQPVDGRPMYVDPSVDKSKVSSSQQFKWSTNMEKNKLFVSGLPRTINKQQLQEFFGKHGTIKDIRIVTYRSGTPKGLAYVEYQDEAEAAKAVLATDGSQMGDFKISVAISNPPARKPKKGTTLEEDLLELPRGPRGPGFGPRGKGRTQLAFMPRAISKPPLPSKTGRQGTGDKQDSTVSSTGSSNSSSSSSSSTTKKMSNADFANLFK